MPHRRRGGGGSRPPDWLLRQAEELFDLGDQLFPQSRHRAVERAFV